MIRCVCAGILSELLQRENRVLHFWTLKKRRLDQCQQYLMFQSHTQQVHKICNVITVTGNAFWNIRGLLMNSYWWLINHTVNRTDLASLSVVEVLISLT